MADSATEPLARQREPRTRSTSLLPPDVRAAPKPPPAGAGVAGGPKRAAVRAPLDSLPSDYYLG